jgi:hypothetical protein
MPSPAKFNLDSDPQLDPVSISKKLLPTIAPQVIFIEEVEEAGCAMRSRHTRVLLRCTLKPAFH